MKLLSIDSNAKTSKNTAHGYLTGIVYLAPADVSGYETCPARSEGCTQACLFTAGRGRMANVWNARVNRTRLFFEDRRAFMDQLVREVQKLRIKARKMGLKPAVRLNGTSDLPWEKFKCYTELGSVANNIMEMFPDVQFYDYTKVYQRAAKYQAGELPDNYHLTFSKTESNDHEIESLLWMADHTSTRSAPVSVVFAGSLPSTFLGRPVVDGDQHDLTFLHGDGVVVGLKAKGDAKRDTSGFVVSLGVDQDGYFNISNAA